MASSPSFAVTVDPSTHSLDIEGTKSSSFSFSSICSSFSFDDESGDGPKTYDTCDDAKKFAEPKMTTYSDGVTVVSHTPLRSDISSYSSLPTVTQKFKDFGSHFTLSVKLEANTPFKTNYIGVAKAKMMIFTGGTSEPDPKTILVPFDNDIISMYQSRSLSSHANNMLPMTSSYVAPFYDENSRAGLVIGALEHTTWKTGLKFHAKTFRLEDFQWGCRDLEVIAGLNGLEETRDWVEHGWVQSEESNVVISPEFFVGSFSDWRDGMEEYARSQLRANTPMPDGVEKPIVGWNR